MAEETLANAVGGKEVTQTDQQQQQQESSLNKEEAPKQEVSSEQSTTETPTKETVEDFDTLLKEKSSGKYNSLSDIENALKEADNKPLDTSKVFANEQMEKLNSYIKDGGTVENFVTSQMVDYKAMGDMDAVRTKVQMENPTLTETEVELMITSRYSLNSEDYTDREVQLAKIKLKQDGQSARQELATFKEKMSVPQAKIDQEEFNKNLIQQKANWAKQVEEVVGGMDKMEFSINKDTNYNHTITPDEKAMLIKDSSNLEKFFEKYMDGNGQTDIRRFNNDLYIMQNFDKILAGAIAQSHSLGKEDIVKDLTNPSFTPDSKSTEEKPKTAQDHVRDAIWGD